jgi:hypothetical protein
LTSLEGWRFPSRSRTCRTHNFVFTSTLTKFQYKLVAAFLFKNSKMSPCPHISLTKKDITSRFHVQRHGAPTRSHREALPSICLACFYHAVITILLRKLATQHSMFGSSTHHVDFLRTDLPSTAWKTRTWPLAFSCQRKDACIKKWLFLSESNAHLPSQSRR